MRVGELEHHRAELLGHDEGLCWLFSSESKDFKVQWTGAGVCVSEKRFFSRKHCEGFFRKIL